MNKYAIAALALLGMSMAATGASAQCYVGAGVGMSIADVGLSAPGIGLDGLGARSRSPDLSATTGCDFRLSNTPFKLGAWGELAASDVQVSLDPSLFTASIKRTYAVGAKLGYDMGGATPYAKLGYRRADLSYGGVAAPIAPAIGLPDKLSGWTYGGGIEMPIKGTALTLGGEVMWTNYKAESIAGGLADLKTDQMSAMLRVNWNFYGAGSTVAPAPLK